MSGPNIDTQANPPFLDEAALQALTVLLDETPPQVVLGAFEDVDDDDAALFFALCAQFKDEEVGNALAAHAGKIFAMLPFDKQVRIAETVTTIEIVDAERARQIWEEQVAKIKEALQKITFLGEGAANLAKLLSYMDIADQNLLLERLATRQPEVVARVSEKLFTFEDLSDLEDEAIKTILQVLENPTLALALHNAPSAIHNRFLENMSASQAEAVEAEIAQLTFEQTQIADTARQSVISLVRNFAAKGLLKIG